MQPNQQQARALEDLRNNVVVKSYLQDCLDDLKTRLVTVVDEGDFRVLQGQARSYRDLLNLIEGTTNRGKR